MPSMRGSAIVTYLTLPGAVSLGGVIALIMIMVWEMVGGETTSFDFIACYSSLNLPIRQAA